MPPKASKGKAKKSSAPTKKAVTHNAVKVKNTRKRQAEEESSDSDSSDELPSPKRKPCKWKKQLPEVHEDHQSNTIPEEVNEESMTRKMVKLKERVMR
jgi:hypothetical protein